MANHKPKIWKCLREKLLVDCRIFKIFSREFAHPDSRKGTFYTIKAPDWVQIIPLTPEKKVLMVNQFRFGTQKFSWEFPGGVIDGTESALSAAKRELLEETGYKPKRVIKLSSLAPNPAIMSNASHIYLALDCLKVSDTNFDANEEIEVKLFEVEALHKMVLQGKINHAIAIDALYFLTQYLCR